jgi:dTDP-4-dehydrorhamnose 3,5-epimerase-like enzyme
MSKLQPIAGGGELSVVTHQSYVDHRGALCPIELSRVLSFPLVRLFWVSRVPAGQERGGHAHKQCSQYLICVEGQVTVSVHDGNRMSEFHLGPGQALLVPPAIWASERYGEGAILLVLCDRPYEKEDYIADMDVFLTYRRELTA